jgi:hypothetical protein
MIVVRPSDFATPTAESAVSKSKVGGEAQGDK